jgi:hypothetical protein
MCHERFLECSVVGQTDDRATSCWNNFRILCYLSIIEFSIWRSRGIVQQSTPYSRRFLSRLTVPALCLRLFVAPVRESFSESQSTLPTSFHRSYDKGHLFGITKDPSPSEPYWHIGSHSWPHESATVSSFHSLSVIYYEFSLNSGSRTSSEPSLSLSLVELIA